MKTIIKQAYRTASEQDENGWFGAGFMQKRGVRNDEINSLFNFFSLVYVINGAGFYHDSKAGKISLSPGSVFMRIPELEHSTILNPEKDWDECYIDLSYTYYESFRNMGLINPEIPVLTCPVSFSLPRKIELLVSEIDHGSDRETPDILLNCITLIRTVVNQKKESELSEPFRKMINQSCSDFDRIYSSRIDLKEYCRNKGYGYESFRKAFRQATGVSPGQYLMKRRMEAACRLLKNRNLTISHISEELGYRSPFEFSAQFKRYMGLSPLRFQTGYI